MIELRGYLTNLGKYNEGELIGEWVTFPIDEDELDEIFERIGINDEYEEYFFTDYECDVSGVCDDLGEYSSIENFNELAEALENADNEDLLAAAIELGGYDVMDIIENIDDYSLRTDINNDYDLGYEYIVEGGVLDTPDYLENYIDYEAFGRDLRMDLYGAFTDWGWVERVG